MMQYLSCVEPCIGIFSLCKQFTVSSMMSDTMMFKTIYIIGSWDRTHTMRNEDDNFLRFLLK